MKKALGALAAVAAIYAPMSAQADGTITFSGSLSAATCTVTGSMPGGTAGSSFTVNLGAPAAAALAGPANSLAGPAVPFSINLTGCTGGTTATTYFWDPATNINSLGHLINEDTSATPATGVELALLDGVSGNPLQLQNGYGFQGVTSVDISSGSATAPFKAQYFRTSTAPTVGNVTTTVNYAISYP
jgi:major type 1 subunit fimbrin (pilin)